MIKLETTPDFETISRLLSSKVWQAMQDAPKYVDGNAIGNCEALKAGGALILASLKASFNEGYKSGAEMAVQKLNEEVAKL